MKSMHCQGQIKKATAPFHIVRKDYHLTLNAVPAWICQQCEDVYFDDPDVDSIQEIIQADEDRTRNLTVAT